MKQFIQREATGVFVWSLVAHMVRMSLSFLVTLSSMNNAGNVHGDDGSCWVNQISDLTRDNMIMKEFINLLSVLSSWVLMCFPSKVNTQHAPGFIFASTWILYPIRDYFGFIPSLPCRICETTMRRLSLRELAIIFPIHFLVPTGAFFILQQFTDIDPVIYSEKHVLDAFLREIFVNALFTVGLLVIPELLRINGIRRGYALLILYPLYSFSVDIDNGMASVFGPNSIYSLRFISKHEEVPLTQWAHLVGPILGSIVGGKIMLSVFPDDK